MIYVTSCSKILWKGNINLIISCGIASPTTLNSQKASKYVIHTSTYSSLISLTFMIQPNIFFTFGIRWFNNTKNIKGTKIMIHQDLSVVTMAGSPLHRVIHSTEFITTYICTWNWYTNHIVTNWQVPLKVGS